MNRVWVEEDNKVTGVVNKFSDEKGYGFIVSDDPNMADIFIHYKQIEPWREGRKTLEVGQSVRFNINEVKGKYQASDLEIHPDDRRSLYANMNTQGVETGRL